ncbi:hypothetical protein KIPB_012712, partial [Kipferlia bialata]
EDAKVFVWDLGALPPYKMIENPELQYGAPGAVSNISWSAQQTRWIAATIGSRLELLHIR